MLSQTARIGLLGGGWAALLVLGTVLLRIPDGAAAPPPNLDSAVYVISTPADFQAVTSTGQVVLFVDCGWNSDVVGFHDPFHEFAGWCRNETSIRPVTVVLDANNQDALWDTLQMLWEDLRVSSGGLKNLGGAGRVVWIDDGEVRDVAWCFHLRDVRELQQRSEAAFGRLSRPGERYSGSMSSVLPIQAAK